MLTGRTRIKGSKADSIPVELRRIGYIDPGTGKRYFFLTNHFRLSAKTVAEIYRARWQVELFFKWIKQHLRIKTFIGTSENAVMSQVFVAMIAYLLLSYLKYSTRSPLSLYETAKRIEVNLFDRVELRALLAALLDSKTEQRKLDRPVQLSFTWFAADSEQQCLLERRPTRALGAEALVAHGA
ncbi:MAG: transposase [Deltaproteobacteria bacterium]|nr:transposase [Deltaproteobacteria bacterium]